MARRSGRNLTQRHRTDRERLDLFVAKARELASTRLARTGVNFQQQIQWDKQTGLHTSLEQPDEDDLRSYLMTFRQFISEGESVFITSIYNICSRCLTDDELKDIIADAREHWKHTLAHAGIQLVVNGRAIAASEVCDWWINGTYFHNDPDHRARLETMQQFPLDHSTFRFVFLNFVIEASRHIAHLRNHILIAQQRGAFHFDDKEERPDAAAPLV